MYKSLAFASVLFASTAFASDEFSTVYKAFQTAFEAEDYQQATTLAEKAYELSREKFGDDNENTNNMYWSLANTYSQNKQHKEAIAIYKDILKQRIEKFGKESTEVLAIRVQLMAEFGNHDSFSKAYTQEGRRVIDLAEELAEKNPDYAASIYNQVIDALSGVKMIPVSIRTLIKFTEVAETALLDKVGKKDIRTIRAQFFLGQLYQANNRKKNAIAQFEKLIVTMEEALDFSHPYELGAHARLVTLYEQTGQSDEATKHCLAIGKMTPWEEDIDPVPLFRQEPSYPLSAARSSRSGSVKMFFDITPNGFVDNIRVSESVGGEAFVAKSKEALSSWRYAPKFVDGEPVSARDQSVRLDFRIE